MSEGIKKWYYQKRVDKGWRGTWVTKKTVSPEEYRDGADFDEWCQKDYRAPLAQIGMYRAISDVGLRMEAEERKVQKGGYDGL